MKFSKYFYQILPFSISIHTLSKIWFGYIIWYLGTVSLEVYLDILFWLFPWYIAFLYRDYNGEDEYSYDGDYGGRVQSIQQIQEERLCPIVNGQQWITCQYNEDDFTADIEDQCTTLAELNEFAECQQGCEEIYPAPSKKPVDNGNDNVPDNGSDDVYDYDDYDIASLGKYIQNGNGRHPLCSF